MALEAYLIPAKTYPAQGGARGKGGTVVPIMLKRVYEEAAPADGYRVLVDRLWPRGVTKQEARLDEWIREASPSDELRKWTHGDPSRWGEFRTRYLSDLNNHRDQLLPLAQRARSEIVTLVFGARDEVQNNAVVLKEYLELLGSD